MTDTDETTRLRAEVERLKAALKHIAWEQAENDQPHLIARTALAAQPAPSGWRPIETAPKDGTAVLMVFVFEDEDVIHDVVYWDGVKSWPWQTDYSGYGEKYAKGWMPLPPAPGKEEA
jgi:hypothetical protein